MTCLRLFRCCVYNHTACLGMFGYRHCEEEARIRYKVVLYQAVFLVCWLPCECYSSSACKVLFEDPVIVRVSRAVC